MTRKILILFIFTSGLPNILCGKRKPCDADDDICYFKSSQLLFSNVTKGVPSLGLEGSDPVYRPIIEQRLQNIHYTLRNAYLIGFSDCYIHNFQFNSDKSKAVGYVICPRLIIESEYEMVGYLGHLYVEGKGYCRIIHDNIHLVFYEDFHYNTIHGIKYMNITDYLLGIDAKDGVTYEFDNLYHGNKELSDAANTYANQIWRLLRDSFQLPLMYAFMDKVLVSANKYLSTTPADEVFSRFE